ncbi:MAG: CBS domain-containing protein [Candidatus Aenigmatarchaeota archaeon]
MRLKALVGEVMQTDVKKLDMAEPIEKAAKIMRDNNIGSIVVIGGKNIKGIVTKSDIVYKYVASGKGKTVADIMSENPITITPDKTIEEAARLMVKENVGKLLVFDKGKLVGIITSRDILKVEPALFEILIERLRIGETRHESNSGMGLLQCESCGNFSESVKEIDGKFLCIECR